jgi:hypothetical protein
MSPIFIAHFWERVKIGGPDKCWPWQAGKGARGERHGSAKLTDAEVAEMRRLRAESEHVRREEVERRKQLGIRTSKHESGRWRKLPPMLSYRALGERFGVSANQAHAICAGKYWRQE